ncbi:MAG: 5'-deoxynucleotidase [Eubacteriales bacterium]
MPKGFFPMISRMRYINRWGLMRNSYPENIQEHSHMVAVLAHGLAVIENNLFQGEYDLGQVALVALYHDASEIFTGDLPTPIKYDNPEIQKAYQSIETIAEEKLCNLLPPSLQESFRPVLSNQDEKIHAIVKAADKLSAYIKCVEEVKAGNSEFLSAQKQTRAALEENPLPSLDYFIQNLLPEFHLTLDQLQEE